jgi:hypothetical protein
MHYQRLPSSHSIFNHGGIYDQGLDSSRDEHAAFQASITMAQTANASVYISMYISMYITT